MHTLLEKHERLLDTCINYFLFFNYIYIFQKTKLPLIYINYN